MSDFVEMLQEHGIQVKEHSSKPGEIFLCCPFCEERDKTPDTEFKLGVNTILGDGHCFRCEWKMRKLALLKLKQKLDLGEWTATVVAPKKKSGPVRLPEDFEQITRPKLGSDNWNDVAYRYLHKRRVTTHQIEDHNIGYSLAGDYAYRIIIPVYYRKKLVAMVGRALKDTMVPKYKNSEGDKSMFNIPNKPRVEAAIISEGVFDALSIERGCGVGYDSLAALGHALTGRQLDQLDQQGYKRYYLWLDPDQAGVDGTIVLAKQLLPLGSVFVVMPKDEDYDPSDIFPDEVRSRIRKAVPWIPELEMKLTAWMAFQED